MRSAAETIRVMVVDDHDMVRAGLQTLLETCPDLELVAQAANGTDALHLCEEARPDVILMDILMPPPDGIETTRRVRQKFPETQIIALTSYEDQCLVENILKAGAISYLLKNITVDRLVEAIHAAYLGQPILVPEATQALVKAMRQPQKPGGNLTHRERDVLALLVDGLSNQEISRRLHLSQSTVKHHVSSILTKLEANTRGEAAVIAVRNQLVD